MVWTENHRRKWELHIALKARKNVSFRKVSRCGIIDSMGIGLKSRRAADKEQHKHVEDRCWHLGD